MCNRLECEQNCGTLSTDRTEAQDERIPDFLEDFKKAQVPETTFNVRTVTTDFDRLVQVYTIY